MKIYKSIITLEEFHKIPIEDRAFIICLGNIVNDCFSKLSQIFLLVNYEGDEINKIINYDCSLRVYIELAGIIYECQNTINQALKSKEIGELYGQNLTDEGKKRFKRIKNLTNEPIKEVRKQLAAHYDFNKIKETMENIELTDYEYYSSDEKNLFRFRMSDIVRGIALNRIFNTDKDEVLSEKAFKDFLDQSISATMDIINYFHEIMEIAFKHYDVDFTTEVLSSDVRIGKLRDFNLPYFIKWR